jgi:hypothetical protein
MKGGGGVVEPVKRDKRKLRKSTHGTKKEQKISEPVYETEIQTELHKHRQKRNDRYKMEAHSDKIPELHDLNFLSTCTYFVSEFT